jgi:hypothetical protein
MLWLIVGDTGDFHFYVCKSDRFVVFQLKFSPKISEQITQPIGVWKQTSNTSKPYCLPGGGSPKESNLCVFSSTKGVVTGASALSMRQALVLGGVFEFLGAITMVSVTVYHCLPLFTTVYHCLPLFTIDGRLMVD